MESLRFGLPIFLQIHNNPNPEQSNHRQGDSIEVDDLRDLILATLLIDVLLLALLGVMVMSIVGECG